MKKFLQDRKRIICILAPLLAGMLYLILCLICLRHSVSTAEAYNAYLVRFDFGGIWNLATSGTEPPLYLFLLKVWAHVFGHADFVLRIMSAMLGALAIMVAYLWVKYNHGATTAIVGAFLLAITPFFVRAGQEICAVTLVILIVMAASFVLQIAVNTKNKVWWAFYAIFVAAGLWTSYFCGLAWLAHLLYLTKILGKKIWQKKIIFAFLAAVVLWLPWVPGLINQINTPQNISNAELNLVNVADAVTETLAYTRAEETHNIVLVLCLILGALAVIMTAHYRRKMPLFSILFAVPAVALLLLALAPKIAFSIWQIPFVGAVLVLIMSIAGTMFARGKVATKKRRGKAKTQKAHVWLVVSMSAVAVVTFSCGLASVYAHEGYDLRLEQKHSADILYENIVELDFDQHLPIVVKTPELYYELSTYTTERNPVTFIEADLVGDYGIFKPLRKSYFGKIANREKFLSEHPAIWLVDYEPDGSEPLEFPVDGWRITTRSDLNFSDGGPTYQILKLEKEQI